MTKRWVLIIMIAALLTGLFAPACAKAAPEGDGSYTHMQLFSADYSLAGVYSECAQTFHTGDWEIIDAQLCLYT